MNSPPLESLELSFASSKVKDGLCLLLKDVDDRVGRFVIPRFMTFVNDLMLDQVGPSAPKSDLCPGEEPIDMALKRDEIGLK